MFVQRDKACKSISCCCCLDCYIYTLDFFASESHLRTYVAKSMMSDQLFVHLYKILALVLLTEISFMHAFQGTRL